MEDVRVVGLSRVSYEAPVLAVVAVGCGRLLSASPWTAEAFGDPVDSYGWKLSEAEGFGHAVDGAWGGESSAESFGEPVQNPEWRWEP